MLAVRGGDSIYFIVAKKNGYELSRKWFDFAFENTERVTSSHTALYLFLCEINNRLGWSESFQITAGECMAGMSCKSYNTYKKCLDNLIEFGFVKLIRKSMNQYQCNIIGLSNFDNTQYKSLAKALMNHLTDHLPITEQITGDIHKPETSNQEPQIIIPEGEPPVSSEPDSLQMPKSEKPKRKVPPKKKEDATPAGLTQRFVEPYNLFMIKHTGFGEKVTAQGRKGLKEIIIHLLSQYGQNNPEWSQEQVQDKAVEIWIAILQNHKRWDKFYQSQYELQQINKNLSNIMGSIKANKPDGKHLDADQLAAEAMQIINNQGN